MQHRIETSFGIATVYSHHVAGPEAPLVVVNPGFSEGGHHTRDLIDCLADHGLSAITFDQPRGFGGEPSGLDAIQRQGLVTSAIIGASVSREVKMHGAGHSMGAAALLKAAQYNPRRFTGLSLHEPVGAAGEQSVLEAASYVARKEWHNLAAAWRGQPSKVKDGPDYTAQADKTEDRPGYAAQPDQESRWPMLRRVALAQAAGTRVLASQPFLALREARAAGTYQLAKDVDAVASKGVPVHIVTAPADELFAYEAVYDGITDGLYPGAASISTIADQKAGHDTFWMQPERTARIIISLLVKNYRPDLAASTSVEPPRSSQRSYVGLLAARRSRHILYTSRE